MPIGALSTTLAAAVPTLRPQSCADGLDRSAESALLVRVEGSVYRVVRSGLAAPARGLAVAE